MTNDNNQVDQPMPSLNCPLVKQVDYALCDIQELAPLLEFLRTKHPVQDKKIFQRGTLLADGRLDLCKQGVGAIGTEQLTAALKHNMQVKHLLMGTDGLGDLGVAYVAELVNHNPHVQTLYLGCNLISAKGAQTLTESLHENHSVRALWLKRNPLGEQGAEHLADLLKHNRSIRTLDVVNTGIGEAGVRKIILSIIKNKTCIERLYLGGNGLSASSATLLSELIKKTYTLKGLYLNVNHIGDTGCRIIADALAETNDKQTSVLQDIGLGSNAISDRGVAYFLAKVEDHNSLKRLDFGYSPSTKILGAKQNIFTDAVVPAVQKYIDKNKKIHSINLNRTGISQAGASRLIRTARNHESLQAIHFGFKLEDVQAREILADLMKKNRSKSVLNIDAANIKSVYR